MERSMRRRWIRFTLRSLLITVAVLGLVFACIANLLHVRRAEQRVAVEITNAGGYIGYALFGIVPQDDPEGWEKGPEWLNRVVFVRLAGSDIDDEQLSRLELQRFKHLRGLSIGYDAVFGADGPKWEDLPAPITDRGLAGLPPFPKLRDLNLWGLPVGDTGLSGLAQKYPRLEHINLWGTRVTDLTMLEVGQLPELIQVDLEKTFVTDSGLIHLAGLNHLLALRLSETRVVGPGLEHLSGLPELRILDLRDTGVGDDHMHHLSRLQRLRSLILWGTDIGDEGVRQLTSLNELKFLDLNDTAVTDVVVKYLIQLPGLDQVNLTGTIVTDAGLAELAKMPNMRHVSLDGTSVTVIGVEDFLRSEPDRTVLYNNQILYVTDLADDN